MTSIDDALARLRSSAAVGDGPVPDGMRTAGVRFAAIGGPLEKRWNQALVELAECIRPLAGSSAVLNEGGVYLGSWIESTATINAELLSRFAPSVTHDTHLLFAQFQREDGMMPYKVTDAGPAFSQIQIVTPFARTVWNQYLLCGRDASYLRTMYDAMERYDAWLAEYRDSGGTGAVEAFCTFDTGHDLSPRFWFIPERCYHDDARHYDPASPVLPYIAPDLTANVACQRSYLALIAEELGLDPKPWREKAAASLSALFEQCFDGDDAAFYDRDATGALRRIQSDVLLRVLACEVGDAVFFTASLERYLMNTRKFLAHYGFTSLAMDDPRFDHDYSRNSWGGPSNFLSLIRAPHAFEHHGHFAELAVSAMPVLSAVASSDRFPQCLDPWTGTPGFTSKYSPSILWLLDAIERHSGILPRPDGELWFSGLIPTRLEHGTATTASAYARTVDAVEFELAGDDESVIVYRDRVEHVRFPRGWRVVTDRAGSVSAVVGLSPVAIPGELVAEGRTIPLVVGPNERVSFRDGRVVERSGPGFIAPRA
ncbi:MGH1-like glycoside hydrolase domain-containing protein [Lacisediminihabitans profunda]|uniref:Mannosylglycerate hydrolase MGH1-like glycoside hydrolase domain-containing protein n=1 Tax=Lacisediminihabitans profunda TaxID=2594790 RepID=A0A5C8UQV3_9MICO|nr:hypothetical protein [Lacisediminihabitans profunda]TXN30905.1 hypothetical protein FVP33_04680 [Lacisediminihabitans profunda]